jgi:hypothetical protein
MVYDYLFYKSYQLAKKLKDWEDTPVYFATIVVGVCAILNFASLLFLLEGLSGNNSRFIDIFSFAKRFKYIFASILMFLFWLFYSYNDRGEKICKKIELKEKIKNNPANPVIVIILAYVLSIVLINISSMYKHHVLPS